jgi:hypothetical protein
METACLERRAEEFLRNFYRKKLLQKVNKDRPCLKKRTCVNKEMFLQMCQLGEGLGTHLAAEGTLARVSSQVHLQVAQLAEDLLAGLTPVLDLAVLLLERVGQGLVARAAHILLIMIKTVIFYSRHN